MLVDGDTTHKLHRLVQFETEGCFPIIQTSSINSLQKTGRVSPVPSYSYLYVALSCEL